MKNLILVLVIILIIWLVVCSFNRLFTDIENIQTDTGLFPRERLGGIELPEGSLPIEPEPEMMVF